MILIHFISLLTGNTVLKNSSGNSISDAYGIVYPALYSGNVYFRFHFTATNTDASTDGTLQIKFYDMSNEGLSVKTLEYTIPKNTTTPTVFVSSYTSSFVDGGVGNFLIAFVRASVSGGVTDTIEVSKVEMEIKQEIENNKLYSLGSFVDLTPSKASETWPSSDVVQAFSKYWKEDNTFGFFSKGDGSKINYRGFVNVYIDRGGSSGYLTVKWAGDSTPGNSSPAHSEELIDNEYFMSKAVMYEVDDIDSSYYYYFIRNGPGSGNYKFKYASLLVAPKGANYVYSLGWRPNFNTCVECNGYFVFHDQANGVIRSVEVNEDGSVASKGTYTQSAPSGTWPLDFLGMVSSTDLGYSHNLLFAGGKSSSRYLRAYYVSSSGSVGSQLSCSSGGWGLAVDSDGYIYSSDSDGIKAYKIESNVFQLKGTETSSESRKSRDIYTDDTFIYSLGNGGQYFVTYTFDGTTWTKKDSEEILVGGSSYYGRKMVSLGNREFLVACTDQILKYFTVDANGNITDAGTFRHFSGSIENDYPVRCWCEAPLWKIEDMIFCHDDFYCGYFLWDSSNHEPVWQGVFYNMNKDKNGAGAPQILTTSGYVYGYNSQFFVRIPWKPTSIGRMRRYLMDRIVYPGYGSSVSAEVKSKLKYNHDFSYWSFCEGGSIEEVRALLVTEDNTQQAAIYSYSQSKRLNNSLVGSVVHRGTSSDFVDDLQTSGEETLAPEIVAANKEMRGLYMRYLVDAYAPAPNYDVSFSDAASFSSALSGVLGVPASFSDSFSITVSSTYLFGFFGKYLSEFIGEASVSGNITAYVGRFLSSIQTYSTFIGKQNFIVDFLSAFSLWSKEVGKQGFKVGFQQDIEIGETLEGLKTFVASFVSDMVFSDQKTFLSGKKAILEGAFKLSSQEEGLAGRQAMFSSLLNVVESLRGLRQMSVSFEASFSAVAPNIIVTKLCDLVASLVVEGTFEATKGYPYNVLHGSVLIFGKPDIGEKMTLPETLYTLGKAGILNVTLDADTNEKV